MQLWPTYLYSAYGGSASRKFKIDKIMHEKSIFEQIHKNAVFRTMEHMFFFAFSRVLLYNKEDYIIERF